MPPLIRPFIYFFYRYIIRLGFLDGKAGFIYHFLQGLWYPFLIDVKYLELKEKTENNTKKYFNNISKDWADKYNYSANFKQRFNEFNLLLNKYAKDCSSVLDYGCGTGNLTELLTKYCSNVTASDLSEEMLAITKKRFENDDRVRVVDLDELNNLKFNFIIY